MTQRRAGEEKSGERVHDGTARAQKTADGCFYDDPRLRAFLEKFVVEKFMVSDAYVPGLTEALELERYHLYLSLFVELIMFGAILCGCSLSYKYCAYYSSRLAFSCSQQVNFTRAICI